MRKGLVGGAALAMLIIALPGTAAAQKETKINGVISSRSGADMNVRSNGTTTTVVLNDSTRVEEKKGSLKLKHSDMAASSLIPGLQVEVKGTPGAKGTINATSIEFSEGSLKTAYEIQAGVNPTAKEANTNQAAIAANKQAIATNTDSIAAADKAIATNKQASDSLGKRFSELGDYNVVGSATVYFGVNSTEINAKGKADLNVMVSKAKTIKAYMIQVAGYTDASGNAAYNQELSDKRAQAVISYLQQTANVPLYRILAPAAMGYSHPAGSNETASGQAENRRVVAKIVVNKGVTGM